LKLHAPRFEKRLRRGVKARVRESKELKGEFRAANRYRKRYRAIPAMRFVMALSFGTVVWSATDSTRHPTSGLAIIALWSFFFIAINVQRLRACLYRATDLPALMLLPFARPVIFRWQFHKFLRGSVWSLLDLLCGFAGLTLLLEFSPQKWFLVLAIAVFTWVTVLALTTICTAYLPRFPYTLLSTAFMCFIAILLATGRFTGNAVLALLDRSANIVLIAIPTGWTVSFFELLLPAPLWWNLVMLVPIIAAIWKIKSSLDRLATSVGYREVVFAEAPDLVPDSVSGTKSIVEPAGEAPIHLGITAIEEIVQSRQFLAPPQWHQLGCSEKLFWLWLTEREKALTEFVFPTGLAFTASWKKVARNLAVGLLTTTVVGLLFPTVRLWIFGIALFIPGCHAVALVLDSGMAFRATHFSGVLTPLYAGYAIGFRELARLLFKSSAVQLPWVVPFASFCGSLLAYLGHLPIVDGAIVGFKAGLLLLAARFILVTFSFSSGTNDGLGLRGLLLLGLVVFGPIAFLMLGGISLVAPNPWTAWLLLAGAIADAYAFFRIYGWFYHASRFDLMRLPQGN